MKKKKKTEKEISFSKSYSVSSGYPAARLLPTLKPTDAGFKGRCVNTAARLQGGHTPPFHAQVHDTAVTQSLKVEPKIKVGFTAIKVYLFFRFHMHHFNVFFKCKVIFLAMYLNFQLENTICLLIEL